MEDNNWGKWQNHVLAELRRLNTNMESFESKNNEDHKDIFTTLATLKVKAGIWGALAGLIPGMLILIWFVFESIAK